MRKKINRLLKEKFEYTPEKLLLSPERIAGTVPAGARVRGKFTVASEQEGLTSGFLYTTDPRLSVSPAMFTGQGESFVYEADIRGLSAGDVLRGEIVLCTANGEYRLPYEFCIEQEEREAEGLPSLSPEEFAALAREDFGRAYVLFAGREFPRLAARWGEKSRTLCEALLEQPVSYHSLEQFLVGMGLKDPVTLSLSADRLFFRDPSQNEREELLLTRDTWGFAQLDISSDAPFLKIERPRVTTEEFVGSTYSCGFFLQKDQLHSGRNYARIRITAQCREYICTVEVKNGGESLSGRERTYRKQELPRLMETYIDYRAGRISCREWCSISLAGIENCQKAGGSHIFLELYRVYLLLMDRDLTGARIRLEELTARKRELTVPCWKGLYLYLTSLENTEKEYGEYVKKEIGELFLANQESWILQWLVQKTDRQSYRNDSERLDAWRQQYYRGCKNPVLYLEAWELLKKEPLLLHGLESFEIHLLCFCCRARLMDREICGQTAQLALRAAAFQPLLYRLLSSCFSEYPTKNLLTAICSLLMKGHRTAPEYGKWFALGVQQDIRLTGLYEYYVMTAEDLGERELPETVQMYFSYNNALDWEKKAALYANAIRNRVRREETWEAYRPAAALFMEEQLRQGRINRDLALIYDTLLTGQILDEAMAGGLCRALAAWEVSCEEPQIRSVKVVHYPLRSAQRAALGGGKAQVQIYDGDCCILLEDQQGLWHADGTLFSIRRLFDRPDFEALAREKCPQSLGLLLKECCGRSQQEITPENAAHFAELSALPAIRESCRRELQESLLSWYALHPAGPGLRTFLRQADQETLLVHDKEAFLELLVSEGLCEEAWGIISENGPEKIAGRTLVRLLSWRIRESDGQPEEGLTALCERCFFEGVYDEAVLRYLAGSYEGPPDRMKAIWRAGKEFLLEEELFPLEEKILALTLFLGEGREGTEEIFADYWKKQGQGRLCRAYAIDLSWHYFVKEEAAGLPVFDYIEQELLGEVNAPKVCQLALLKNYAYRESLSAGQQKWRDYLLEKFNGQGLRFAFFQRFPEKLLRKLGLYDRYLVEYRADPGEHVTLAYRINGGREISVPMNQVYEGIFGAEFTLFYRDRLSWCIRVEERPDTAEKWQSYECLRRGRRGATGKYELINRLLEAIEKKDEKQIQEIREQYIGQQYLAEELF